MDTNQQILIEQRISNDSKNIVQAYLLWFFLWPFGAHRFYLGQTGSAIIMLIISITFFGLIITGIWALIDLFLIPGYVDKNKAELRQRYTLEAMAMNSGSTAHQPAAQGAPQPQQIDATPDNEPEAEKPIKQEE